MLQRLSIKNYALIDALDISFSEGLNMITGETGAGKSIILGALSLILGQRAESRYFFNQEKKCVIEGTFAINGYRLEDFFTQNDLDYADETIIRREITSDGKSRAFVNDTPVNLFSLKILGEKLIDIHSQHATLELNSPTFQRLVVDSIADHFEELLSFRSSFKGLKKLEAELKKLEEESRQAQTDHDYLQFQFDELEKARLVEGEQERLEQELYTLTHAEEIKRYLLEASHGLSESEQSAEMLLKHAVQSLQNIEGKHADAAALNERLRSVQIELKDISEEISIIEQKVLVDESRINEVNERVSELFSLQKKHRVNSAQKLIELRDSLSDKLESQSNADEKISAMKSALEKQRAQLVQQAAKLFEKRKKAIPVIEKTVQENLREMGMADAKLNININNLPQNELDENGSDTIKFLFSANKGHALGEMNKVASGGELSRLMLGIKSLIAQKTALPTVIFDEIDTGISGETARQVGQVMERLAKNLQVITITHLPQIASKGKQHYTVYKENSGKVTSTQMKLLTENERINEVAKMLSGNQPTPTALQNAKELLEN